MKNYVIKTKRLNLQLLKTEDISYLDALESDPEVKQFFPDGPRERVKTGNIGSTRVMEKCGMTYYKTDIAKGIECKFYRIKNR
jgi:hypothetical protein